MFSKEFFENVVARFSVLKVVCLVLVGGLVLTSFTGCAKKEPEVYKIGAILPLTGPGANIGEWQKNGIDLAIEEINKSGGINGKKVEVVYEDSKLQAKEGVTVFNKIISVEKLPAIFVCGSAVSNAILPIADKQKVNLLMSAVSYTDIASRSPWAFRFYVGSDDEANVMAKYIVKSLKYRKVGVLYISDDFGLGAYNTLKKIFEEKGIKIVWSNSYSPEASDFRSILSSIKNLDIDALYIVGYSKPAAIAMKQARELGINMPILCNMAMSVPPLRKLAGDAAEGSYYTTCLFDSSSKEKIVVEFVKKYVSKYNNQPSFFSGFAYDTIKILCETIRNKGYSSESIQKGLLEIKDFPGIMGTTSILSTGDVKYKVRVVKLEKEQLQEVFTE